MQEFTRAKNLHQGKFSRLIKITQATSRYPERDVLVLMLGHHCFMRVTEISLLTVSDVMPASGRLRSEISMREAITKGRRYRFVYLASKPAIQALENYLKWRIEGGIGVILGALPYQGLLPHQPVTDSSRGDGMSQNTKRRALETGEKKDYRACDSLQAHVTKLDQRAGIKGGSSHAGRRTFASKVLATSGDMATVAHLLGHASIDCLQRCVDVDQRTLQVMFADGT